MATVPLSSQEAGTESIVFGDWLGSMRSVTGDQVPPQYIASINSTTPSHNALYLPRTRSWKTRGGATEKFDTFGSEVGLLPAKWTNDPISGSGHSRARHMEEFVSDSITDGVPTQATLLTRETVVTGTLDDGRFSTLWLRDQVNDVSYTFGDEYSTTTYPAPGAVQQYRVTPLWYESGDGGITRGVTEFARRFFFPGSRRFMKAGNWWYHPSRYGTPSRWNGKFISGQAFTGTSATSTVAAGAWLDSTGGTSLHTFIDEATPDDTDFIAVRVDSGGGGQVSAQIGIASPSPTPAAATPHVIQFRYRRVAGTVTTHSLSAVLYKGNAVTTVHSATIANLPISTSWTDFTYTLTAGEVATLRDATAGGAYANMRMFFNWSGANDGAVEGPKIEVSWFRFSIGNVLTTLQLTNNANYLFPTGPHPPLHAGTVTASAAVTAIYMRPDSDISDGSWINSAGNNTDLFSYIDEVTADDTTTWIKSNTSNTACDIGFATPSSPPATGDTVTLRYRISGIVLPNVNLSVDVRDGTTSYATASHAFTTSFGYTDYALQLPATAVDNITAADATWAGVYVRFTTSNEAGLETILVTQAFFEILPAALDSEGGWKGKDRFFQAVAGRWEDDSIWLMTQPRFPNDTLATGLDLVTVDAANPDVPYTSVTRSHLPVLPTGFKTLILLRSDKIDSTVDDNLLLNPTGLKVIAEVANGTTTYVDYKGDDASLTLDVEQYFIRYDHIMAPRCRYLAGGDMRVVTSYGGTNPCAITIAPVGRDADWDLNLPDTDATLWNQKSSYMRLALDTSGVMTLTLLRDTGAATDATTFTSSTYPTIQELLDAINNTSVAVNNKQWRAQLCEHNSGGIGQALMTDLCPHSRDIASCTVSGQTITVQSNALGKVAVGAYISGTGVTAGAYVTSIDSVTSTHSQLTFTGTITAGVVTLTFYFRLGDDPTSLPNAGYQRVIAGCIPGFLYFNKAYLDQQTFDKSATWMTVATPGSVKAAPNAWSNELANRFSPPLHAGICQGVAAVDQGFVVAYGNKIGAIRPRGPDSFTDAEYGLTIIDESRGCCAWNTVTPGNRFVPFLSAEGMFVSDLTDTRLISEAIYVDQPTALGDFSYEGPQSVAAAAADTDGSYAWARILRGVLWVGYRTSASTTHVDRRVRLDFSSGDEATGIPALYRRPGVLWGWSTPLLGASAAAGGNYSIMSEGRRSDGFHLYGWHDTQGTTGDGRLDEVETGTTDNGTAVTSRVELPWVRPPDSELISAQEVILEHSSPAASTGSLVYHRSFSDDAYPLTPGTSALGLYSEMKFLPQGARANANAGYVDYRQATGSARELRRVILKVKRVQRFKT